MKNKRDKISEAFCKYKELRKKVDVMDLSLTSDDINMNSKIAIIVPFRDNKLQKRRKQLDRFIHFIENYLRGTDYRIITVEQSNDNMRFNRGALLNVGYKIAERKGFTYAIYHDVDLLPSEELLPYYTYYPTKPIHLAWVWKEKYNFSTFFGGAISISNDTYKRINGFPNNFWGWGGEDDALYNRFSTNNIPIYHPTTGVYKEMKHIATNDIKEFVNKQKKMNVLGDLRTWRNNGVDQVSYKLLSKKIINQYTKIYTVDITSNKTF